jgi:hypothetical protein
MNYGVKYILVKSNWFDPQLEKTKMSKIEAKGLLVYLTLFKFKLFDFDKNNNTFVTSINMIAKEIPSKLRFSKDDICELVRHLQREKVINITNVSNWNTQMYKFVEDKEEGYKKVVDYDRVLVIDAIDYPQTNASNENGKWLDKPVSEDDFYIAVNTSMIESYLYTFKFDEKYLVLLVFMQKYHRTSNGFYMSMEKMEHVTGIGKNIINRMTWKMYKLKILSAYRKENGKGEYYHEYHICSSTDKEYYDKYLSSHEKNIESWLRKLKKKDQLPTEAEVKVAKVENKMKHSEVVVESQIDVPVEPKLGFGTKKAQVNESWGDSSPFDDCEDKYTHYNLEEDDEFNKLFG